LETVLKSIPDPTGIVMVSLSSFILSVKFQEMYTSVKYAVFSSTLMVQYKEMEKRYQFGSNTPISKDAKDFLMI
jgi:multidrug transporter EmrE-like cation transporter